MAKSESKGYNPAAVERGIFDKWENGGYFRARPEDAGNKPPFCMVIPPPNVTGALHLGHALNNTLQDILVRRKRMEGFNTFWLVGTDHAGIATQAVVEKTIRKEEGKSRHDLGREELVRRIWEWKEKYGGRIIEQLRLMGCSCDYSRERFTLDEGCVAAVRETFFKLFRDGLIYRGKRLVNWDTQLQTAVADDEVYHEQVKGHFYYFKYPIIDSKAGEPTHVLIATTRPETMLADTAVAVHPDPAGALDAVWADLCEKARLAPPKEKAELEKTIEELAERRNTMIPTLVKLRDMAQAGCKIRLPLVDREIPLICDEWADPALGTGCVKITPAHDANDYEVGKRHGLPMINVMTPDGKIAEIVEPDGKTNPNSSKYAGLAFSAKGREKVVADLQELGLVEKIEDRLIDLGHSDRSKSPIEPFLSDQWFVKMGDLSAEEAERIQSPLMRQYVAEPRPSGSGDRANEMALSSERRPLPDGRGSDRLGLAQMAVDAVKSGAVKFHPPRYEKTYTDWLGEKRDWCISRQLWWGHRIPVWHKRIDITQKSLGEAVASGIDDLIGNVGPGLCGRIVRESDGFVVPEVGVRVFLSNPDNFGSYNLYVCNAVHREHEKWLAQLAFTQDPDVLDTWFSSALWPHSTLGWTGGPGAGASGSDRASPMPQAASLLDAYYPTSVLSTAREIITLWVARMVMTGLYNIGEVPFTDVVIHPVIQDGDGRKMSKTLGNGVDPVDIIEEYGADALRFTLADLATETQDIRMPVQSKKMADGRTINVSPKFEKGRNFCNKLWQAATGYVLRSVGSAGASPSPMGASPSLSTSTTTVVGSDGAAGARSTAGGGAGGIGSAGASPSQAGASPSESPVGDRCHTEPPVGNRWHTETPVENRCHMRPLEPAKLRLEDRWILSRMTACIGEVSRALDAYRFSEAVGAAYRFVWDEYCSWYIEMTKTRLAGNAETSKSRNAETGEGNREQGTGNREDNLREGIPAEEGARKDSRTSDFRTSDSRTSGEDRATAQQVLVYVLDQILRLLHPFIPFVTEAVWEELNRVAPRRGLRDITQGEPMLVAAAWPKADESLRDAETEKRMERLQEVIRGLRDIRTEVNDHRARAKQPSMRTLPAAALRPSGATGDLFTTYRAFVTSLGGCDLLTIDAAAAKPKGAMSRVFADAELYVPVAELIDLGAVRKAQESEVAELRATLGREQGRLSSANFVERADPAVVEAARERARDLERRIALIEQHLRDFN